MLKRISSNYVLPLILIIASLSGGYYVTNKGFDSVKQMRQLERVPQSKVGALLPGEANISAETAKYLQTVNSTHTKTPSIYYRYIKETEEEDSDGGTHWVVVDSRIEHVDFFIKDETGKALVDTGSSTIDWTVPLKHREIESGFRYTEYRLEPGDLIFIFGMAEIVGNQIQINFEDPGSYTPIISTESEIEERQYMGNASVESLWLGITLISFCVYFLAYMFQIHRLLVYLSLLTLMLSSLLIDMGLSMMKNDLQSGISRYENQYESASLRAKQLLEREGVSFHGWNDLYEFDDIRYRYVESASKEKIKEIRQNLLMARQQLITHMSAVPEKYFMNLWGMHEPEILPAPSSAIDTLNERIEAFEPTRLDRFLPTVLMLFAMAVSGVLALLGVREVKAKRFLENITTSNTTGVAYGACEVKGKLSIDEGVDALLSPLSENKCAWYYYHVEELRGSGKDEKWVTIVKNVKYIDFYCKDDAGKIKVDAEDVELITEQTVIKREGNIRYTEKSLNIGDDLYVIGYADLSKNINKNLTIGKSNGTEPFIVSNLPEKEIMIRKARKGMLELHFSFSAMVLACLLFFGMAGGFSPTDFIVSALLAPVFMIVIMFVFHYNDLIYLGSMVDRNKANIEVSLKKRYNMIPNMESIVAEYSAYESDLIDQITQYRTLFNKSSDDVDNISDLLARQIEVEASFDMLIEDYPELKSNKLVSRMMDMLSLLENEIMQMRHGYNNAVEVYNTRINSVPDIVFTKMFDFKEKEFIGR